MQINFVLIFPIVMGIWFAVNEHFFRIHFCKTEMPPFSWILRQSDQGNMYSNVPVGMGFNAPPATW